MFRTFSGATLKAYGTLPSMDVPNQQWISRLKARIAEMEDEARVMKTVGDVAGSTAMRAEIEALLLAVKLREENEPDS